MIRDFIRAAMKSRGVCRNTISFIFVGFLLTACATTATYPLQQTNFQTLLQESRVISVPLVLQKSIEYEGAAVLESLLLYWKQPVFQHAIVQQYPPASKQDGYTSSEMQVILQRLGFDVIVLKTDFSFIRQQVLRGYPLIVKLQKNRRAHYVLVHGIHEQGVWIMDPELGFGFMRNSDFQALWELSENTVVFASR